MSSAFSSVFDSVSRQIKSLKQTPFEKKVSDATSNDNWGVANSVLIEIAKETFEFNNCGIIMKEIFEALTEKREKWRRIYKALNMLEYCVKYGAERVVNEARAESGKLRALLEFKFMEGGRDKGPGIREKSKYLVDLLGNQEELKKERLKAQESKEKYSGVSSAGTTAVPAGYASTAPASSAGGLSHLSSENTTSKLDEYREKERKKLESQNNNSKSVNVNVNPSGKIVVNKSGLINTGGNSKQSTPPSSASSLSPEKKISENLIDFDAPVVVTQKPAVCSPGYPAPQLQHGTVKQVNGNSNSLIQTSGTGISNPYMQQPAGTGIQQQAGASNPYVQQATVGGSTNPYMQQPVGSGAQQPTGVSNPYAQQPMGNPYVQQSASGLAKPQMSSLTPQPQMASLTPQTQMASLTLQTQMSSSAPQTQMASNPYMQTGTAPNPYMQMGTPSSQGNQAYMQMGTPSSAAYMQMGTAPNPYMQSPTPSQGNQAYMQMGTVPNPYMQTPTPSQGNQALKGNPYMQTGTSSNPYMQPQTGNMYMQTPAQGNPYGQPPMAANPYMQTGTTYGPPTGGNSRGNNQSNPFSAFNGL